MAEQTWTDDPIDADDRKEAIHFTELQDAINLYEDSYGIAETVYTDAPAAGVKIKLTAITEMQDAVDALDTLVSGPGFSWTTPILTDKVKPAHINEIRTNVNTLQDGYCYLCDLCDTDSGCDCDTVCDSDACTTCNAACHPSYTGCTCNPACNNDTCQCDVSCNGDLGKGCSICINCNNDVCSCHSACFPHSGCDCYTGCDSDNCTNCDAACYPNTCSQCHGVAFRYPWT